MTKLIGPIWRAVLVGSLTLFLSGVGMHAIAQSRQPTTLELDLSYGPDGKIYAGNEISVTATVKASDPAAVGGGVVTLTHRGRVIGSQRIPKGRNVVDIAADGLPWGDQRIEGSYSGNVSSQPSATTTTAHVSPRNETSHVNIPGCSGSGSGSVSMPPPLCRPAEGEPTTIHLILFRAEYGRPSGRSPTGTVKFSMYGRADSLFPAFGPEPLGQVPVHDWVATIETRKLRGRRQPGRYDSWGCYEVIAEYGGDALFAPTVDKMTVCPIPRVIAPATPEPSLLPLAPLTPLPTALPTLPPILRRPPAVFGADDLVDERGAAGHLPLSIAAGLLVVNAAALAFALRPGEPRTR
jgi:hypothetical protein